MGSTLSLDESDGVAAVFLSTVLFLELSHLTVFESICEKCVDDAYKLAALTYADCELFFADANFFDELKISVVAAAAEALCHGVVNYCCVGSACLNLEESLCLSGKTRYVLFAEFFDCCSFTCGTAFNCDLLAFESFNRVELRVLVYDYLAVFSVGVGEVHSFCKLVCNCHTVPDSVDLL